MVKSTNALEDKLGGNVGWVLVMLLVAGSSFLLGSSVNNNRSAHDSSGNKSGQQSIVEQPAAPTQSVVTDISNTLQNPPSANPPASGLTASNDTVASPAISGIVNINTASAGELDTLPGIGPAYANAIINYRLTNGPFVRIEDIVKVKGIGPKTFEKLKSRITI